MFRTVFGIYDVANETCTPRVPCQWNTVCEWKGKEQFTEWMLIFSRLPVNLTHWNSLNRRSHYWYVIKNRYQKAFRLIMRLNNASIIWDATELAPFQNWLWVRITANTSGRPPKLPLSSVTVRSVDIVASHIVPAYWQWRGSGIDNTFLTVFALIRYIA